MFSTVRQALRLVDAWTRRRVALSGAFALVLAALEMAAFGLLYVLISLLADENSRPPPIVDSALGALGAEERSSLLSILGLFVVAAMLMKSCIAIAVARWQTRVQNVSEARLASRLYREYLDQDFLFHVSRNSSTLIRNLTGSIGIVATSVIGSVVILATEGLVLLGTLTVVSLAAPGLALGVAAFAAVILTGYIWVLGPTIHRAAAQDQRLTAESIRALQEGFDGIKSVHVYNVNDAVHRNYEEQRNLLAVSRATLAFTQRLPQYYLEACLVIGAASATAIMVSTLGQDRAFVLLGLLVVAALRVLPSVNRILGALNAIRGGAPAVALLRAEGAGLPARARRAADTVTTVPPGQPASLVLTDVSFRYPERTKDVLRGISVRIAAGSFVGIVGPSGAGKTTLVDVVLGLLHPWHGTVQIDGQVLDEASRDAWRARVGYVPQETYLLDGTLRENVLFHRVLAGADLDARIWGALASAQLADVVRELPEGLDSAVGERGVRLSGGQKQRLGIARALLARPSVLVLDEATSALDGATEAAVASTISSLRGNLTLIVIAHRLSTLRNCDELILLEDGEVVAIGSLIELARVSPSFAATLEHAALRGAQA